jgi:hypothetical protein
MEIGVGGCGGRGGCDIDNSTAHSTLHQNSAPCTSTICKEGYSKRHPVVSEHFFFSAPESNSVAIAVGHRTQDRWLPGKHSAL